MLKLKLFPLAVPKGNLRWSNIQNVVMCLTFSSRFFILELQRSGEQPAVLGFIITAALSPSHTRVIVIPLAFLWPCIVSYVCELKLVHHISSCCVSDSNHLMCRPLNAGNVRQDCFDCVPVWRCFTVGLIASSWYYGMFSYN